MIEGGCLCGAIRLEITEAAQRVTVCFCRFCQKATGSAHMVEPIFRSSALRIARGLPRTYRHRSGGSGKIVFVHFCATCGTKLYLGFERWEDRIGAYAGALDDPTGIRLVHETTKFIFADEAPPGAMIPAGFPVFGQHSITNEGSLLEPVILREPRTIVRRGDWR